MFMTFLVYMNNKTFIHSIGMCRMQWFLAVLRSFIRSSLLLIYTISFHPFPPTSLPSSLTSFCLYFLVYLSALLLPNSYIILFEGFYHSRSFRYSRLLGLLTPVTHGMLTYVQEPLAISRRSCAGRHLKEKYVSSGQWTLAVRWGSQLRTRATWVREYQRRW
jgi:hypothetical protein